MAFKILSGLKRTWNGFKADNVVFVENPTTGINAVMNSLHFEDGDTILMYSHTYNAVKNIVQMTSSKTKAGIHW